MAYVLLGLLMIILLSAGGVLIYARNLFAGVFNRKKDSGHEPFALTEADMKGKSPEILSLTEAAIARFRSLPFEILTLQSNDVRLKAYYLCPDKPQGTVLTIHGWKDLAQYRMMDALDYYDNGYAVLVPDLRGHGLSGGRYVDLACRFKTDINAWIDYLIVHDRDHRPFILDGVSMGAATVLCLSGAHQLHPEVICVIGDCGYTSFKDECLYIGQNKPQWIQKLTLLLLSLMSRIHFGYSVFHCQTPIEQVAKAKVPIMIIHGQEDLFVPHRMGEELFANVQSKGSIFWSVEGAEHAKSVVTAGPEYVKRKLAFIEKAKQLWSSEKS